MKTSVDLEQIHALVLRWERAWNDHDMQGLQSLFTEDADFVNVGAKHWKGRAEIGAQHVARLAQFIESTWTTTMTTAQFLRPDIALVHVDWSLTGDRDPDGTPRKPRTGVFTWLATNLSGEWRIRAAQNTNTSSVPPREA